MTHAIIVAAGNGKRFGGAVKKQFALLRKSPVIVHTLTPFFLSAQIDTVSCVIAKEDISSFNTMMSDYPAIKIDHLIEGGARRQDSVAEGVFFLANHYGANDLVVIHDGARPFVTPDLIQKVIDSASDAQGAVAALPIFDSLKEVSADGVLVRSIARAGVWAMQTPQVFPLGVLAQAMRSAQSSSFVGTDEAAVLERIGYPIVCVMGEKENIKITTTEDLVQAEKILEVRSA
jgi:2-C-methyl-D-erythritol 4-phosphate cytidylyltransferase